jgi:Ser/Thr protein kinase RdoA (MazF antagonist)
VFEHLGSQHPNADHLTILAQALGKLHAAAYTKHLHTAHLDVPFSTQRGLIITDFISPRRTALQRMPLLVNGQPAAFYKDANIRNFLLADNGVAIVDFDDLTLAPFGYDLAKLIVSTAMTHGQLDLHQVEQALQQYNSHTAQADRQATCSMHQLQAYAESHHLLTARYLHRNGYRYPWPEVCPWSKWDSCSR